MFFSFLLILWIEAKEIFFISVKSVNDLSDKLTHLWLLNLLIKGYIILGDYSFRFARIDNGSETKSNLGETVGYDGCPRSDLCRLTESEEVTRLTKGKGQLNSTLLFLTTVNTVWQTYNQRVSYRETLKRSRILRVFRRLGFIKICSIFHLF